MKKFLSLLCMITCVFGLTACGSSETYTEYEQNKINAAIEKATYIVPTFEAFQNVELQEAFSEYTAEEVEDVVLNKMLGIEVEGYAYKTAITSFVSGYETIGAIVEVGEATATIDEDQIIVLVPIDGENKDAEAEIIFSNDKFLVLESASLNPKEDMGELMAKAGMNTLIGMGTVFIVLILISLIISCFGVIPKIQAAFAKKNDKEEEKSSGIDNAVAQIVEQEEVVDETDDLELVAVIAAAIAASEGTATTDGFVVRSIRRVR